MSADPRLPLTPDTIAIYSDLNCSFAHLAVHRLHETRTRLGLDGILWFDHRCFNNEVNAHPEIAAVGPLEPSAGWRLLSGPQWTYLVTMLPSLEAVQAAKSQSPHASEQLDRALRRAFWSSGRCISLRHEILAVAEETGVVDVPMLAAALDSGSARASVMAHYHTAHSAEVLCSPHVFLYDGSNFANPGVRVHWQNGPFGVGFPVIDADDPGIYTDILTRAAELATRAA